MGGACRRGRTLKARAISLYHCGSHGRDSVICSGGHAMGMAVVKRKYIAHVFSVRESSARPPVPPCRSNSAFDSLSRPSRAFESNSVSKNGLSRQGNVGLAATMF